MAYIYDDVLDITWLQDANYAQTSGYDSDGRMHWLQAKAWAAQLSYDGHDDWRLPSANLINSANPCYAYYGSCDFGYNNTTSELGHMFYNNLGRLSFSININVNFTDGATSNVVSILSLQNHEYNQSDWYSEEYVPGPTDAWAFKMVNGFQFADNKNASDYHYGWPVHDGDIGASPVPLPAGIYLFLSGLVGLGLVRRSNFK